MRSSRHVSWCSGQWAEMTGEMIIQSLRRVRFMLHLGALLILNSKVSLQVLQDHFRCFWISLNMQEKKVQWKSCFSYIAVNARQKKINVSITTIDKHTQTLKSHTSYPCPHITLFQFWTSLFVKWKLLALNLSLASSLPTYTLTIFSLTAPCFTLPFCFFDKLGQKENLLGIQIKLAWLLLR